MQQEEVQEEVKVKITVDCSDWEEKKVCPIMSQNDTRLCVEQMCAWWVTSTDYQLGRSVLNGCALPLATRFLAEMD